MNDVEVFPWRAEYADSLCLFEGGVVSCIAAIVACAGIHVPTFSAMLSTFMASDPFEAIPRQWPKTWTVERRLGIGIFFHLGDVPSKTALTDTYSW